MTRKLDKGRGKEEKKETAGWKLVKPVAGILRSDANKNHPTPKSLFLPGAFSFRAKKGRGGSQSALGSASTEDERRAIFSAKHINLGSRRQET